MEKFTLYAYTFRSRAERVLWALNEYGFEYELVRLDITKGETQTDDFLSLNPQKKIPVLVHGDKALTESLAIMEYLETCSDKVKLIPQDKDQHYQYRQISSFIATEIEAYLWLAEQSSRLSHLYSWPQGTYEQAIKSTQKALDVFSNELEQRDFKQGQYLLTSGFSLVDIFAHHVFTWAQQHKLILSPSISCYLEFLQQRPHIPSTI